jgi:hypothetical protein
LIGRVDGGLRTGKIEGEGITALRDVFLTGNIRSSFLAGIGCGWMIGVSDRLTFASSTGSGGFWGFDTDIGTSSGFGSFFATSSEITGSGAFWGFDTDIGTSSGFGSLSGAFWGFDTNIGASPFETGDEFAVSRAFALSSSFGAMF